MGDMHRPGGLPPSAAVERDKAIAGAARAFEKLCDAATAALELMVEEGRK